MEKFKKFFKNNWYYLVLALSIVFFAFGAWSYVSNKNNKFQDTYSIMSELPKKADLKSVNGNFQANFKNGAVIKRVDNKNNLMRTSYVFDSGIIPTGRVIINTVEKVKITKNGKGYTVKPTGELVALSASSNNVSKATTGFKNKQAQINGSKELISKEVAYIVNAKDKSLTSEIKKNCKVVKTKQGNQIVEFESKNMKNELVSEWKKGTPKDDSYKYENMYLISKTNKVRSADKKQIVTDNNLYSKFN